MGLFALARRAVMMRLVGDWELTDAEQSVINLSRILLDALDAEDGPYVRTIFSDDTRKAMAQLRIQHEVLNAEHRAGLNAMEGWA